MKPQYPKKVEEALMDVTRAVLNNESLLKLLYYQEKNPLNQQVLSDRQKDELIGKQIVMAPRGKSIEKLVELRYYFVNGAPDPEDSYDYKATFKVDIYVPDTLLLIIDGQRNWRIADQFIRSVGFWGYDNIGKPLLNIFEQKATADEGISCLGLSSHVKIST